MLRAPDKLSRHRTEGNHVRISDVDEAELLARIGPYLPRGDATRLGPGDDAAVVAAADGRFVVTTDVQVQDRHFRRDWSTGTDVGRRAAAVNFADVAAMGARPTCLVTALVLPAQEEVDWVLQLARGLGQECRRWGAGAVGGDLSGGPVVTVSVTAHGDLQGRTPVLRSGARPGDVLAHAGTLGFSAAGLALLTAGVPAERIQGGQAAVRTYLCPDAPIAAGPAAARSGAHAMLDVSDGLLRDAGRMAAASNVCLDLDGGALARAAEQLAAPARECSLDPLRWILGGGEDHGLLAAFPPEVPLPHGFEPIGQVAAAPAGAVHVDGTAPATREIGWEHFNRG